MGKSLNEKLNELPEDRRERIFAEADRLHDEYLTLQELRKDKRLTDPDAVGRGAEHPPADHCTDEEAQ